MNKQQIWLASYCLGAILTYGYGYTHFTGNFDGVEFSGGALAGAFWPLYWAGRLAIEITKGWAF